MPKIFQVEHKLNWSFFCPGCKCHHGISTIEPGPVWNWNGSVDLPTFTPSLLVRMGPRCDENGLAIPDSPKRVCHSFITDGRIQFLDDCTHELAGKTVDMEEV